MDSWLFWNENEPQYSETTILLNYCGQKTNLSQLEVASM